MQAFRMESYGGAGRMAEIAAPTPGPGEVLLGTAAASLNQLDAKILAGEFRQILPYRLPHTLGHDVAGTVLALGAGVDGVAVGDEVMANVAGPHMGALAEQVRVPAADLAPRPHGASWEEAAALPLVALTAWQALVERGGIGPGSRVLIHAGAGAVGTVAIQLAHHLGAEVSTTVSGRNAALVRELGADLVVDYRSQDFATELSGYDLVLDSLGGENLERSLEVLRPGGLAIGISGPPDPAFARRAGLNPVLRLAITAASRRLRAMARRRGVRYEFLFMRPDGPQLREIGALVEQGVVRPVLARTLPFARTAEAMEAMTRGGAAGKTVVTLDHPTTGSSR